jgi:hypothetical protein
MCIIIHTYIYVYIHIHILNINPFFHSAPNKEIPVKIKEKNNEIFIDNNSSSSPIHTIENLKFLCDDSHWDERLKVYMCLCIYVSIHMHMFTCICKCVYIYMCVYICVY